MESKKKHYLDLQVHTSRYSPCSTIPPEQIIAVARSRRLDGIALVEHSCRWSHDEIEQLKAACGRPSFPVLSGYEIRTRSNDRPTGDLLVFGVLSLAQQSYSIDALCREVHEQGGIVIAPHPFAGLQGIGDEVYSARIDGIEVYNSRYRSRRQAHLAEQAWQQLDLAGVASSDAHDLSEIGLFCTEFDDPITSEQALISAIIARRCRPRCKPPPGRFWRVLGMR